MPSIFHWWPLYFWVAAVAVTVYYFIWARSRVSMSFTGYRGRTGSVAYLLVMLAAAVTAASVLYGHFDNGNNQARASEPAAAKAGHAQSVPKTVQAPVMPNALKALTAGLKPVEQGTEASAKASTAAAAKALRAKQAKKARAKALKEKRARLARAKALRAKRAREAAARAQARAASHTVVTSHYTPPAPVTHTAAPVPVTHYTPPTPTYKPDPAPSRPVSRPKPDPVPKKVYIPPPAPKPQPKPGVSLPPVPPPQPPPTTTTTTP